MNDYALSLQAYLARKENTETELAGKASIPQSLINRYRNGIRFPRGDTARRLDEATGGEVPFSIWQRVAAQRAGIAA